MAQTPITSFCVGAVTIKQEPGIENNNDNQNENASTEISTVRIKDEPKSPIQSTSSDATVDYQINQNDFHANVKMEEEDQIDSDAETENGDDFEQIDSNCQTKMEPEDVDSDADTLPDEQMDTDIYAPIVPIKSEPISLSVNKNFDIAALHARYMGSIIPSTSREANNIDNATPSTSRDAYKRKNEPHTNENINENLIKKSKRNESPTNYDLFEKVEKTIEQSMKNTQIDIDNNEKYQMNANRTSRFCVTQNTTNDDNLDDLIELKDLVEAHLAEEEKLEKELLNQTGERLKEITNKTNVDHLEKVKLLRQIEEIQKKQKQREADKMLDDIESVKIDTRKKASQYLQNMFNDFDFDKFDELNELHTIPKIENRKYRDFYANVINITDNDEIFDHKTQRVLKHLTKGKCDSEIPKAISLIVQREKDKIMNYVSKHLQQYLDKQTINQRMYNVLVANTVDHFQKIKNFGKF